MVNRRIVHAETQAALEGVMLLRAAQLGHMAEVHGYLFIYCPACQLTGRAVWDEEDRYGQLGFTPLSLLSHRCTGMHK
jgi:hypothetical protein